MPRTRPVGIVVPNTEPDAEKAVRTFPRAAEELGFSSLWVTDHVVGVRGMAPVHGPFWLDAVTCLAHLAATTSVARLGIGVLVVPYRNPVLTAKMLTTIDLLSDGRLDIGIGTGWSRTEYRALGVRHLFEGRGRATDEALEVMRKCWRGGAVEHDGEFFSFEHIAFEPTPAQKPHPPLWIGGQSGPALRRAARLADTWHPHDLSPREVRATGDRLDELAGRAVPRSVRIHVTADDIPALADVVDSYLDAGCRQVVIEFRSVPVETTHECAEKAAAVLFA
jgi:probable F420-dependent oxidoreductase